LLSVICVSEALALLLDYGFKALNLNNIIELFRNPIASGIVSI
jgi:hypothetical protein